MRSEGWLGHETIVDKLISCFAKHSISDVSFPNTKDFGNGVVFEKLNISDDVEQSAFMHPV